MAVSVYPSNPDTLTARVAAIEVRPGRNKVINGDFRINQRSYVSGATIPNQGFCFDRWYALKAGGGPVTFTAAPQGQVITLGASLGLYQVIERANLPAGRYVLTWKGTATGEAFSGSIFSSTIPPGTGLSGAIIDLDGLNNCTVHFGTPGAVTATLSEVQFERIGDAGVAANATPFETVIYSDALVMCQRFYVRQTSGTSLYRIFGSGNAALATACNVNVKLPVVMRAVPTFSFSATTWQLSDRLASYAASTITLSYAQDDWAFLAVGVASGLTPGRTYDLQNDGVAGRWLEFSAELLV